MKKLQLTILTISNFVFYILTLVNLFYAYIQARGKVSHLVMQPEGSNPPFIVEYDYSASTIIFWVSIFSFFIITLHLGIYFLVKRYLKSKKSVDNLFILIYIVFICTLVALFNLLLYMTF